MMAPLEDPEEENEQKFLQKKWARLTQKISLDRDTMTRTSLSATDSWDQGDMHREF